MNISKLKIIILLLGVFVFRTNSQWTKITSAPTKLYYDIVESSGILYIASNTSGIYRSTDGTLTWQQINNGLNTNQALSVSQILILENNMYAATVDGIYKSTDSGTSWIRKSTGIAIGGGSIYANTESIFELNGNLFTGAYTGIYRSTNGSESWQVTNISGSSVNAKNFINHNGILFSARESINDPVGYQSSDSGITWSPITSLNIPMITFLSEGTNLWAGTIDGVWLSTNNGSNWQMRNNGLSLDPYSSSIIRVNGTLVTSLKFGGSGMFKSSDNGLNWENIGTGLPFLLSIEKLIIFNGKIIAATSAGLWQRNISEIVVGNKNQSTELPQSYNLYQNYPNPFNPSTKIKFDITSKVKSEKSKVKLVIYNVLGKEIINLVNEEFKSGTYEVEWDASSYSSGIYYYRLIAGGFSETRKMILMK